MKNRKKIFLIVSLVVMESCFIFAQESAKEEKSTSKTDSEATQTATGFPEITEKPYVLYDWGVSYDLVTRIQTQEERSNFVYQDHLLGAFFGIKTGNMKPFDSLAELTVYMPFVKTFNGMTQKSKQGFLYAFDLYWGPKIDLDMWKYITFNLSLGPHFMYELSDEYHLVYLGGVVFARANFPLTKKWTIFTEGFATLDYANFGTNYVIQPFNVSYSYKWNLGAHFSSKALNEYSYIESKPKTQEQIDKENEKIAAKQAKQAEKQALKEAKLAEKQALKEERLAEKQAKLAEKQALKEAKQAQQASQQSQGAQ